MSQDEPTNIAEIRRRLLEDYKEKSKSGGNVSVSSLFDNKDKKSERRFRRALRHYSSWSY